MSRPRTRNVFCPLFVSALTLAAIPLATLAERPDDRRHGELTDLDGHFPFAVPSTREAWERRADFLRRRILVATGLWPLPERTPLRTRIWGLAERDGFTIEKATFESYPGHVVTGLLFRPEGRPSALRPAVLCPHGHGGRMQDHGKSIKGLIESGQERFEDSGRFPKLARCAQLARMGCVVYIFDMLGYADSQQISRQLAHGFSRQRPELDSPERWGLFSTQAEMRLQSIMGIQTWSSIRALDFLESLPDVDPSRIGVTGGSGGGTQTILLCAIDSRPVVAFPQGMVSTSMQGGCTCENCSLLRIDSGNVELAALFAPKPQAMTAANDWTKAMMKDGYPELQKLYSLYDARDRVWCKAYLEFPHNYNAVTRRHMYEWFKTHLRLPSETSTEELDWAPLGDAEATLWDHEHPAPPGGEAYELELTAQLAELDRRMLEELRPRGPASLSKFRRVIGTALETIIGRGIASGSDIERHELVKELRDGYLEFHDQLRLASRDETVPVLWLYPKAREWNGAVTVWIDGAGSSAILDSSGAPRAAARSIIDAGGAIAALDLFMQGQHVNGGAPPEETRVVKNPREFAGFTFCYNDTLFARRVHDVLTVLGFIAADGRVESIGLLATSGAGAIGAAATALAGDVVDRRAIDTAGFRFKTLRSYRDPSFLPGAVKYGDLPAMLALGAPTPLLLGGESSTLDLVSAAYASSGAGDSVERDTSDDFARAAAAWLATR